MNLKFLDRFRRLPGERTAGALETEKLGDGRMNSSDHMKNPSPKAARRQRARNRFFAVLE